MRTQQDVEAYLRSMGRPFRDADDGTFLVRVEGGSIALKVDAPLVLARVEVGPAPKTGREALFHHLLSLNATALVHAAYGLDDERIVLAASLELENLDYNELDALLAELDLALAQQLPKIRELAANGEK
jgi:hypothetical protein